MPPLPRAALEHEAHSFFLHVNAGVTEADAAVESGRAIGEGARLGTRRRYKEEKQESDTEE
eukprot:2169102-Pyramimonas_sp.AAC.1